MATIENTPNLAVLVLAAGNSSRLGHPKQLVELAGQTLLQRQISLALSVSKNVYVVLGYNFELMFEHIKQQPIEVINNELWQSGLSASISAGVKSLSSDVDGVMILLVDQWQITSAALQSLVELWQVESKKIICAAHEGDSALGPPVIFPSRFFSQLSTLEEGIGAKYILTKHTNDVCTFHMPSAFIDLDTPEQLDYCLANFSVNFDKY